MSEDDNIPTQNKAFLRQYEIQRLNKTCNRIIDLRGKVAGECLAYTFGDRTHYLDDRAYLLAKQLLNRFNGRYTVGVYESLLTALKRLKQQQNTTNFKTQKDILHQDPIQPQHIPFDQHLQLKEQRIIYTSSVDVFIDEVLYHGSTTDITRSSIRVVLRRAHTMEKGDSLGVTFSGFNSTYSINLLTKIKYKVVKIDHDEKHTYLILVRNIDDNVRVTTWFDDWTLKSENITHIDLDPSIFNLASRYYLSLFTHSLNTPLLWLSHSNDPQPIKAFHLMPSDEKVLECLQNSGSRPDLSLLPLNKIMTDNESYLVVIYKESDEVKSVAVPCNMPNLIAKALNWYQHQQHSNILLLRPTKQKITPSNYADEIAFITDIDQDYGDLLSSDLSSIRQCISIIDLSSTCLNISTEVIFSKSELSRYRSLNSEQHQQSTTTSFKHYIQRRNQRFFVNTPVIVHVGKQSLKASTIDLSIDGLSILVAGELIIPQNNQITVDFTRWQSQTKEHNLMAIPFLVKNTVITEKGQLRLGLQRFSRSCPTNINKFFKDMIERNKDKLALNDRDIILDKEISIYRRFLPTTITSTPLFFGVDKDKKRILQAIATTEFNSANNYESLWRALTKMVVPLSEIIKDQTHRNNSCVNFGLYCYQNKSKNNDWVINTDFDFSYTAEKDLFINRAIANDRYLFFQCSLMPIQFNLLDDEKDLHTQLLTLRNQSPYKVKQVRDILYGLFGFGHLIDVTNIIEAAYKDT
jgi:hypothetical protein